MPRIFPNSMSQKRYIAPPNTLYKNKGKKPQPIENYIEERYSVYDLSTPPTIDNFIGSDKNEPPVYKKFGCKRHLSQTELLFGNFCIIHAP